MFLPRYDSIPLFLEIPKFWICKRCDKLKSVTIFIDCFPVTKSSVLVTANNLTKPN